VIALHGHYANGPGQEVLSHLAEVADDGCFLAVFPDGIARSWNDARGVGGAAEEKIDDIGFIALLIDRLIADHGADPSQIYLAGMSNGAMMSHTAACALSDRIAGFAAVAGNLPEALASSDRCAAARPMTVLLFAGTEDPLVPFGGGSVARSHGRVLSAEASAAFWAARSRCDGDPERAELPDRDPEDGTRIRTVAWRRCELGQEVALYIIDGGGHTWPGGWPYLGRWLVGRTSRELDASVEIWREFSSHPRTAPAP
jgi:polyhydroxybutyrate depolymerase